MIYYKKRSLLLSGILISFIIGFIFGSPNFFNVGNPISAFTGIVKLTFTDENIVKISSNPERYIARIDEGSDPIITIYFEDGWEFRENMGLDDSYGPVLTKGDDQLGIKSIHFTRNYRVWEVVYNTYNQ